MNDKILEEYVNYMGITRKLKNVHFIQDKKMKNKTFINLQMLVEDRILYRYKHKLLPPYHGYHPIDDEEMTMINEHFTDIINYHKKINTQNELVNKLDKIKEYFLNLITNKKSINKHMYDDIDFNIIETNEYVKFRKIKIQLDNRLRFLLKKAGKQKFLRFILRYLGYGITAQHCSIITSVYRFLYDKFNIRGEGFSSPLNSKLIQMKGTVFCTLFKDADNVFGSQGPFSYKVLLKNSDKSFTVNPPYMPNVMYTAYINIKKAFKNIKRDDYTIIVLIPKWETDKTYMKLLKFKYLVKLIEPDIGKHYMNCNGRIVHMNSPINSMFILSRNKNLVTDELVNELLRLWNTYEEDNDNQSSFSEAHIE